MVFEVIAFCRAIALPKLQRLKAFHVIANLK